ncbi:hypothetical protein B0I35DRAFT_277901 [Stachybotrys elegans]|uniref:Uncharacterized protein n=1 Tax=Stachybotrys elegans TaxID=80388 RepID=A0A8K0SPV5_9HYPO|nr:hypothetical protein B0I35DRAFT_277901 [Stachybotrys elegans]
MAYRAYVSEFSAVGWSTARKFGVSDNLWPGTMVWRCGCGRRISRLGCGDSFDAGTVQSMYYVYIDMRLVLSGRIGYSGATFGHLVPVGDPDPEVLQINIIEMEDDSGVYANRWLPFQVDVAQYSGHMVLAVPRCCQKRKGMQDRFKVNELVAERENEGARGYSGSGAH